MKAALALFAKAPELGKVKTRLARTHGEEFALQLAHAMLGDTLSLCRGVNVETRLFLTPDGFDSLSLWTGQTHPQGEGNLWTRLLRADAMLRREGFDTVVIIGSDSPDLPSLIIKAALHFLGTRSLVVGPSTDGGFYLLGSSRPLPKDLFQDVPISSRQTFAALKANLHRLQHEQDLKFLTLTEWRDVDEEEDLKLFIERLHDAPNAAPQCRAVLEKWHLL